MKPKLVSHTGEEITTPLKKVTGVKPCGSQVLFEAFTAQELSGSFLKLPTDSKINVPLQGYIRGAGPSFNGDNWGFQVGDRVLISGGGVLAPNYTQIDRDTFLIEPHAVKCVVLE